MHIDYVEEIKKLKREMNAIVLAHNYQDPLIQDIADYVGDSLELSIKASTANVKYVVFCGVDFMAEQAAALNEKSVVLHPEPQAKCPMAAMITLQDVLEAKKKYPKAPVVMYVNVPALVKAYSDYVVTSANAVKLVASLKEDTVIFGPDKHLANYISRMTGKEVIPIPRDGFCPVHVVFNKAEINELRKLYRGATFIAHPECPHEIRELAEVIGSTSQMIRQVRGVASKVVLVGTEIGIIYRLSKENPDKVFIPASTNAICWDMKKITLEKVYNSLKNKVYRVEIDKEIRDRLKKAIENTFNVLGEEPPWRR
ncbi:MAG: quinolinate synthase NadA [Acidilobaceae archaeon]